MRKDYYLTDFHITTEKRSDDWIVFLNDDRSQWESGKTETETIGKLVVSYCPETRIASEPD